MDNQIGLGGKILYSVNRFLQSPDYIVISIFVEADMAIADLDKGKICACGATLIRSRC
jgi:hypothetical protein